MRTKTHEDRTHWSGRTYLCLLALLALVAGLPAGPAGSAEHQVRLLKDPGPGSMGLHAREAMAGLDGILLFTAGVDAYGYELWGSDGTATGTVLVKDINLGVASSEPYGYTEANGTLFFGADDGIHGWALWKTDGTEAGTVMVKDLHPGAGSTWGLLEFTEMNGTLYFRGDDEAHGAELWKSDGTAAGTVMVKDIYPGPAWSYPGYLIEVDGTLFFHADDGVHGTELWKSDGTAAGTVMVKDIRPGAEGSNPDERAAINGILLFTAHETVHGRELWRSDGTAAGTFLLKDTYAPTWGAGPRYFAPWGDTLYFSARDVDHGYELWKSDGTAAGTVMIKDINPGPDTAQPASLYVMDDVLYFKASDGIHSYEIWKSDGTAAGTVMIKDIFPGAWDSWPENLAGLDGILYFNARTTVFDRELWRSDGTEAGTWMARDIRPGSDGSYPRFFINVDDILYFWADDEVHGAEPWIVEIVNTSVGTNVPVTVTASDGTVITLTFDEVTEAGHTRARRVDCGLLEPPPSQFSLCLFDPVCYEITSSASFVRDVQVCIPYASSCAPAAFEDRITLGHDEDLDGVVDDITDPGYPDTTGDIVCGSTSHLSPFSLLFECVVEIDCPDPADLETGPGATECGLRHDPDPATAVASCGLDSVTDPPDTFFPVGTTGLLYEALDRKGNVASCTTEVRVEDTTPPVVMPGGNTLACLWPPNHDLVCYDRNDFSPEVFDNCPGPVWHFTGCASSQADNGRGDGNTADDCAVDPAGGWLCARAERSGREGDGRYYAVSITATDWVGNEGAEEDIGQVLVPHDQRNGLPEICRPVLTSRPPAPLPPPVQSDPGPASPSASKEEAGRPHSPRPR